MDTVRGIIYGTLLCLLLLGCKATPQSIESTAVMANVSVKSAEAKSKKKRRKRRKRRKTSSSKRKTASVSKTKRRKRDVLASKTARKIRLAQAKRLDAIQRYKKKLYIGEMDDGLLGIRPQARIPSSVKRKVKLIVKSENSSRERIYKMIVKENNYNKDMEKVLRQKFFDSYRGWDPQGAYFSFDKNWQN